MSRGEKRTRHEVTRLTGWSARAARRRAGEFIAIWFSPARWSFDDIVTALAALVLAVSVFFPWFQATVQIMRTSMQGQLISPKGTISGIALHQYLWAVVALALLEFAVLATHYLPRRPPVTLPGYRQFLIVASGLNCAVVVGSLAVKPDNWRGVKMYPPFHLVVGWGYGAAVALVAAIGTLGAAIVAYRDRASRLR